MDDLKPQPSAVQIDAQAQAVSDLEAVLGLPQGRRLLLRILERCDVYRDPFRLDRGDEAKIVGEQNIARWLIDEIGNIGPTEYPQLLLDAARMRGMTKDTVHVVDEE